MNWYELLVGKEGIFFLLEIAFRSFIMFILVLILLRLTGKRSIKQLSIFEIVMIIALGSAAGDPMIYKEIGILQATVVFIVVLISYKIITYLITKSEKIESFLEGKAIYIIHNGHAALESINHTDLAMDEFFAELRVLNIEHLGQVKEAILETNGHVSILFYEDIDVKHGLPIWPKEWSKKSETIKVEDIYACSLCGFTLTLAEGKGGKCPFCKKNKEWVKAIESKRIV
ncbi:MAG: DUF421 domain-containing protein [Bacteroidales bacterium]|jgi:uncharacterized membrane protein YcaP (DUF421 family)|nr:DUF421 domain-containing protein [Bacteroidales bacterium]